MHGLSPVCGRNLHQMGTAIKSGKPLQTRPDQQILMTEAPSTSQASPANPLLGAWDTPFAAPPFAAIRPEHFGPAFETALAEHRREVAAVAAQTAAPTFANTVAALERAGRTLAR